MIVVISHAWAMSASDVAAYVETYREFGSLHESAEGFRGRHLSRDNDDPLHLVNVRYFDRPEDYEALVGHPDYRGWIERLSAHVEHRSPDRVIASTLVHQEDPEASQE